LFSIVPMICVIYTILWLSFIGFYTLNSVAITYVVWSLSFITLLIFVGGAPLLPSKAGISCAISRKNYTLLIIGTIDFELS